ncbi:MAG: MurR/RpiR family transcriptional regulator [Rickettsiales bacterium]|nr:MurR/RpiR family transcriptional regulator [Rickettsiales bacterium]
MSNPHTEFEQIKKRLKELSPEFPRQLRAAADYVLEHQREVAMDTVRETSKNANVTTSTMVRLATVLGFDNYSDFREVFRKDIMEAPSSSFEQKAFDLLQTKLKGNRSIEEPILKAMSQAFADDTLQTIPKVVSKLLNAKRIYIFGMRDLFSCAFHFFYLMKIVYPNTYLIRAQEGMLFDEVTHFREDDAFIVFGSSPHTKEMVTFYETIKQSKASIISVTDSYTSKISAGADYVFAMGSESLNFFPSILPYIALAEILVMEYVTKGGEPILKNINAFEQRQKQFSTYAD